ncbi:hypothetical protein J4771_02905 [Candidatus Kaistella beijingensis]|uniref:hypothetical protein n=1 Tax=Candidatus Kaistella beijingensis TaxID=2820270 RepID=UPI001CC6B62C|nr:hypothetical protein [Candidatus Kaistella beijingensis]UBB90323.1 hypothetical protein J4771_02905 [Candidatus Kaistella beijingensis]
MTINQLADSALEYLKGFFPDADKIQLEEIEKTDDNLYCFITLSYESSDIPEPTNSWLIKKSRKFKIFKIDVETGEVRSMKIRDLKI